MMSNRVRVRLTKMASWTLSLFFWIVVSAVHVAAQNSGSDSIATLGLDTKKVTVPMGAVSSFQMTFDPGPNASDTIDIVVSDPAAAITITTPRGLQVSNVNASSTGFGWQVTTLVPGAIQGPSVFDILGTHTIVSLPPGSVAGVYQISVDATSSTANCSVVVSYLSSSSVAAALTAGTSAAVVGRPVMLSGILLDDASTIVGAVPTVTVVPSIDVSAQVTIGSLTLLSSTAVDADTTADTFSIPLTNNGSKLIGVTAGLSLQSLPTGVITDVTSIAFGNVAAGALSQNINTITVTHPNTPTFDPATIRWQIDALSAATQVSLTDSGQYDAQTGDGIYSGAFTPSAPGIYRAIMTATGTSNSDTPFSRTAATTCTVTAPLASFNSIQAAAAMNGPGTLTEQVAVTATVNVETAGTYLFSISLQAGNGSSMQAMATAALTTGTQTIAVSFAAGSLYGLGVDGPYQLVNAQLYYQDQFKQVLADSRSQAGATPAVALSSLDCGPIYFTGQNSAVGVSTMPGNSLFEILVDNWNYLA